MGVLGPRTVFVLAIKGFPGTHEFLLQDDGKFIHVKETTEIGGCGLGWLWARTWAGAGCVRKKSAGFLLTCCMQEVGWRGGDGGSVKAAEVRV